MSLEPLSPPSISPAPAAKPLPEPARIEVSYASAGRRIWAFVLDMFVLLLAAQLAAQGGSAGWIIYGAFLVAYYIGLIGEGGTPGMRLAGLRVTRVDGAAPGIGSATVRAIVFPASALALGAGLLWMLDQPRCQTWHDIAASTIVVRERRVRTIASWSDQQPWK